MDYLVFIAEDATVQMIPAEHFTITHGCSETQIHHLNDDYQYLEVTKLEALVGAGKALEYFNKLIQESISWAS